MGLHVSSFPLILMAALPYITFSSMVCHNTGLVSGFRVDGMLKIRGF